MPSSITVVVAFDMIGGLGTVIIVVVVTAGLAVVVVLGITVVVALVVVVAFIVGCSVCVFALVVVVAPTGSCRADTGSVVVSRVVVRLSVSVADTAAVAVDTGVVVVVVRAVVVVVAIGSVAFGVVLTSRLVALLETARVSSLSVIISEVEVVGSVCTVSAVGSTVCAQPDSRAASMSIAKAFFICPHLPLKCPAPAKLHAGSRRCSFTRWR